MEIVNLRYLGLSRIFFPTPYFQSFLPGFNYFVIFFPFFYPSYSENYARLYPFLLTFPTLLLKSIKKHVLLPLSSFILL